MKIKKEIHELIHQMLDTAREPIERAVLVGTTQTFAREGLDQKCKMKKEKARIIHSVG